MTVFSFSKGSSTVFSLPPFSLGGEGRGDLQVVTKVVPLCKNGKKMEECSYIIHNICVLLSLLATNLLAQEIKKKCKYLILEEQNISAGGSGSQHIAILPVRVKV